jgi:type I restriction enzyme, S subunit
MSSEEIQAKQGALDARNLPEGWSRSTLSDVSTRIQYGYTASAVNGSPGLRFLRITDIQNGQVDWTNVPTCAITESNSKKYQLRPGDIVFARTGATTGKSFLLQSCPDAVFASYLIRLSLLSGMDPGFIAHFLQTAEYWQFISENVAGNAQPNCNASKLAALPVPLAPQPEQRRISMKLEQLFARVESSKRRLLKTSSILSRFSQAVLAAACSGKLTEDWRIEHPHIESAAQLLEKINGPQKLRESMASQDLEELPKSWKWVRFGGLISELRNGISTKPEINPPGLPILRISSVRAGKVILGDYRYLRAKGSFSANHLRNGDLLFTRYNGTLNLLGVCGMVRGLENDLLYPDKLMRVRFDHPWVLPAYAEIFFCAPAARDRMTGKAKSSAGQQGVSGESVKAQPFALPPLEEQQEIVRRVEALFKLADAFEQRVNAASLRAERLTQAILAKAFRGELVPTEAELARREERTYEPASALLARIKSERARLSENGDKRRKGRK